MQSIGDVKCACLCGWSGKVYDCDPDDDGSLLCPECWSIAYQLFNKRNIIRFWIINKLWSIFVITIVPILSEILVRQQKDITRQEKLMWHLREQ